MEEAAAPSGGDSGGGGGALEAALLQLGHFGLYQRYVLLLLCLPHALGAMTSLSYVFVEEQVPFRCVVPECEAAGGAGPQYAAAEARALLPPDAPCRRYAPLTPPLPAHVGNCSRARYHRADTVPCDALVYQRTDTVYSEFGLACRRRPAAGWARETALPLALLLAGYLADRYGRRAALCALGGLAGALGVARGCAPDLAAYLALQFAGVALGHGFTSAAFVMVIEVARPSLRASFASATGVSLGLGGAVLALVARRAGGWRRLLWATHVPALLLLPLCRLLLPESARWLHAAGLGARLQRHLRRAALCNKVKISEELLEALDVNKTSPTERATAEGNPWAQLARSRVLLVRLALCGWCGAAAATLRRGLASQPLRLARDSHADFALSMGMEVVAALLLMMALERCGRKRSILAAFLASGAACVAPFVVSHVRAGLLLQFGGELSVTLASSSLRVLTAELFPTRTRSSALAGCELAGWLGAELATWLKLPGASAQALLHGALAATAALAVQLVPETRRVPLPHSVRDAELLRPAPAVPSAPPPPAAPRVISADA